MDQPLDPPARGEAYIHYGERQHFMKGWVSAPAAKAPATPLPIPRLCHAAGTGRACRRWTGASNCSPTIAGACSASRTATTAMAARFTPGSTTFWRRTGIVAKGARRVLCYPRILGYVFNPLSVWFCDDEQGRLKAIIYEVHNTYEERHAYVLPVDGDAAVIRHDCAKHSMSRPFCRPIAAIGFRISSSGRKCRHCHSRGGSRRPDPGCELCRKRGVNWMTMRWPGCCCAIP